MIRATTAHAIAKRMSYSFAWWRSDARGWVCAMYDDDGLDVESIDGLADLDADARHLIECELALSHFTEAGLAPGKVDQ